MVKQIQITANELEGFTPQAAIDLEASVASYKNDLVKEIGRIEAGQNAGSGTPEVTSSMVQEAEAVFSRGKIFKSRKKGDKALRLFSVIGLFVSGAMVQVDLLKEFLYLITFLLVISGTIFLNVLLHLRDSLD